MLGEVYKESFDRNKPIATIELGNYLVMVFPRPEGGYFLRPVQSGRKDILEKTRDLPPKTISQFIVDYPDLLEVVQAGAVIAPTVNWRPGSGLLEEPQIEITGRDGFGFGFTKTTLFDNEVTDLLSIPVGAKGQKTASFVSMNTTAGDVLGIVVRRNCPILILVTPTIDGQKGSSKEGLNNLLTGILTGLTSKLSTFEAQVMTALAQASADEYFDLPYDSTTIAGKLHNNLLMQIYTARTLFLCRVAQVRGTGLTDPDLIAQFPYLKTLGKKTGLASIFGGNGSKRYKLEPQIWDEMIEDASLGISLNNPNDRTPRPSRVVPLMQRGIKTAAPQVMSAAEIEAVRKKQTLVQAVSTASASAKVETRPQIATEISAVVEYLEKALGGYRYVRAEKMTAEEFEAGTERLRTALKELTPWRSKVKKMRPPVTPTKVDFQTNLTKVAMFGLVNGAGLLDFVQPTGEAVYYEAVERSWQKWQDLTSYTDLNLRSSREARLAKSLLTSSKLLPIAEVLKTAFGFKDARMINQGIDLMRLSYLIMSEKTLYILSESGRQISARGDEAEINNWIHYAAAILERMIRLSEELK